MKCGLCNAEAKYLLHQQLQPHCQHHFDEAIEGCTAPTIIMSADTWESMQKGVQKDGRPAA